MTREQQIKDFMRCRQSIRIETAMLDERFKDINKSTFMRVCRAAGFSCADGRVSRRVTKLESNCFRCECDRSGVMSALGKKVKRLAHYVGSTFR